MFLETILADATHADDDTRTTPSAITGQWRSRLGSTMTLTVADDHRIEGTFHTAVGTIDPTRAFHVVATQKATPSPSASTSAVGVRSLHGQAITFPTTTATVWSRSGI